MATEALAGLRVAPSAPGDSLDVAWREAEAALPERWRVGEVKNTEYRGDDERWLVMAWEFGDEPDYRVFESAYANTPAAALRALAERLRSEPTGATEPRRVIPDEDSGL